MIRRLRAILWALLLAGLLAGCARTAGDPTATGGALGAGDPSIEGNLTVFAAASLTEPFTAMKTELEAANPGLTITFNFAGSSQLRAQLAEGARADVFASADEQTMAAARADGVIDGEPEIFAYNRLVVIVPADNPAGIETPRDLARPGVKLVLAQAQVPVGRYSRQTLAAMSRDGEYGAGFAERVLANLVSEEANVKAVAAKVQLGEADAGIVYASDVTPALRAAVRVIEIPDAFNVIAEYPVAVVAGATNPAGARAFIDYLLSPAGQEILRQHGFIVSSPPAALDANGGL